LCLIIKVKDEAKEIIYVLLYFVYAAKNKLLLDNTFIIQRGNSWCLISFTGIQAGLILIVWNLAFY